MRISLQLPIFPLWFGLALLLASRPDLAHSGEACGFADSVDTRIATRNESGDESGIGGTGARNSNPIEDRLYGDDSESGIGGTGIIGTVTRTSPLCVNGLEIELSESLSSALSVADSTTPKLATGMVVWIRAMQVAAKLIAERIEIHPGLIGQIETVTARGHRLMVSGHPVQLTETAQRNHALVANPLSIGQWARFHGLRDGSGVFVASRIEKSAESELRQTDRSLSNWLAENDDLRRISIEGYVTGSSDRPRLAGLDLQFNPAENMAKPSALEPGTRLTLEGRISARRTLQIEGTPRVTKPPWTTPLHLPTQPQPQLQPVPEKRPQSQSRPEATESRPNRPPTLSDLGRPKLRPQHVRPNRPDLQRRN